METGNNEELVQVLNDLIRINNDRISGYEKAIEEAKDGDQELVAVFNRMIEESRQYKAELLEATRAAGGDVETDGTTHSGKLYRFWMDIKNTVSGKDKESLLDDCEFGEDAAQKAYQEALESEATMDADIRKLIINQKTSLRQSHDTIKRMRDLQKEVTGAVNHSSTSSYNQ